MLISSIQVKFQGHGPIGLVKNTCCLIPLSHSRLPRLPLVQWRLHIKWSRKTRRSGNILSDAAGKYPPGNEESYPTFYGKFGKSTIQKCLTTGWDMGQFPQRYPKTIWVKINYPNRLFVWFQWILFRRQRLMNKWNVLNITDFDKGHVLKSVLHASPQQLSVVGWNSTKWSSNHRGYVPKHQQRPRIDIEELLTIKGHICPWKSTTSWFI